MGLDAPDTKMSKSLAEQRKGHAVGLLDSPDEVRKVCRLLVREGTSAPLVSPENIHW